MSKFLSEQKKNLGFLLVSWEKTHICMTRHVLHKFVDYKRLRQLIKGIQQIGQFY